MKPSRGKYWSAMTKVVNVLSPEIILNGEADGFTVIGRQQETVRFGESRLFSRGLRQRYGTTWKRQEHFGKLSAALGRSVLLWHRANKMQQPKREEV